VTATGTGARSRAVAALPSHVEARHLLAAGGGCVALAVVGLVDPSRHALTPPCPLRSLTGLDCPLCGATRATHALLHGDVVRALDLNALYVVALPVVAVLLLAWLRSGELPALARRRSVVVAVVVLTAVFTVARNVPPFTVLGT
jgi:hypothetical protein